MIVRDIAKISLSNLGRRKVRTLLTTSGVIVGILTIVTMVSLGIGVQEQMLRNVRALGMETIFVQPATEEQNVFTMFMQLAQPKRTRIITPAIVAQFKQMDGVSQVTPEVDFAVPMVLKYDGQQTAAFPGSSRVQNPFQATVVMVAGRSLSTNEPSGLVIGEVLARELGVRNVASMVGQEVTVELEQPRGDQLDLPIKVVGVSNGRTLEVAFGDKVRLKEWWFNKQNLLETDGYDVVMVKASSLSKVTPLAKQLEDMGYKVQTLLSMVDLANRMVAIMQTMLASVGALATFVASLGIVNTMIMAIYERTREIGILKALGASRGDILRLFMTEAGLIGLMGGIVGLILGWLLGLGLDWVAHQYIGSQGITITDPFFMVNGWLIFGALAFGTLVGLFAGIYPASRAARLDPIAALRHE